MMKRLVLALLAGLVLATPAARAADGMDPAPARESAAAVDAGLHYPAHPAGCGRVGRRGRSESRPCRCAPFSRSPRGYNEGDKSPSSRGRSISSMSKRSATMDRSASRCTNTSYNTAVALNALAATKNPKYEAVIVERTKFPHSSSDRRGGGLQAGSTATTAGSATAVTSGPTCRTYTSRSRDSRPRRPTPKDPVWQKALVFVNRMPEPQREQRPEVGGRAMGGSSTSPG